MIGKHLKEIMRTPFQTASFFMLIVFAAVLFTAGSIMTYIAAVNTKNIEKNYSTVAVVGLKPDRTEVIPIYNAQTKTYRYKKTSVYDTLITADVFDEVFDEYIIPPEQRPYYAAYSPEIKVFERDMSNYLLSNILIAEVSPLENCTPDHAVKVRIERVIFGNVPGKEFYICDHFNDSARPLLKGKRYVVSLQAGGFAHAQDGSLIADMQNGENLFEYHITDVLKNGEKYDEVTPNFYSTERGKSWRRVGEALFKDAYTFPVIPTSSSDMLMLFYNGLAVFTEGREISHEEYLSGKRVCMIRDDISGLNGLKVGDKIPLNLYYADYNTSPAKRYTEPDAAGVQIKFIDNILDADGKPYKPFLSEEYEIVGVFSVIGAESEYALGRNAVIIPSASVKNCNANVAASGPMQHFSTSFILPNKSIKEYEAIFAPLADKIDIRFFDKGYSHIKERLETLKLMSAILLAAGALCVIGVFVFFAHVFVSRRSNDILVERALGIPKKKCILAKVAVLVIIAVFGSMLGCVSGAAVGEIAAHRVMQDKNVYYDTEFSLLDMQNEYTLRTAEISSIVPLCFLFLAVSSFTVSFAVVKRAVSIKNDRLIRRS